MDEDAFNMSVRKFLKKLGVTAQREIELGVREQLQAGKLPDARGKSDDRPIGPPARRCRDRDDRADLIRRVRAG